MFKREPLNMGTIFSNSLFTHTCYPKSECESQPLDLNHIPICIPCELVMFLSFLRMTFLLDLETIHSISSGPFQTFSYTFLVYMGHRFKVRFIQR